MNETYIFTFADKQPQPALSNYLLRIATRFSGDDLDLRDDLFQAICEALLNAERANPEFPKQKFAYIARAAQLTALHALRSQSTYERYNAPLASQPGTGDTGETLFHADMIAAPGASPEQAAIMAESAFAILDALRKLTPRDQEIAKMLYQGYKPSEIADALHIRRDTISQRRKIILAAARAAL